jgi:hypothetical protein
MKTDFRLYSEIFMVICRERTERRKMMFETEDEEEEEVRMK